MSEIQTIPVQVGKGYEVRVGHGLLDTVGKAVKESFPDSRTVIVTDSNVAPLYLGRVLDSLRLAGIDAGSCVFAAGETHKNMETLTGILNEAALFRLNRKDLLIALGGGVCGDMTGFAAGCYMRGIPFIQIPTTVLSMVDSSVGGKCAVDLPAGKNLAGVFHQPSLVLCDIDTLDTLPSAFFADGMAEAVKTAVLTGGRLAELCLTPDRDNVRSIITECIRYKAGVVQRDERELGERKLLNLGHTAGHAIEKCSGFQIPHGHAVAVGTAMIARAADLKGFSDGSVSETVEKMLLAWDLPLHTSFSADDLLEAAKSDKKAGGAGITAVIPRSVGHCELMDLTFDELYELFRIGL